MTKHAACLADGCVCMCVYVCVCVLLCLADVLVLAGILIGSQETSSCRHSQRVGKYDGRPWLVSV